MRSPLVVSAAFEVATGLALLLSPSTPVSLLLGGIARRDTGGSMVGRVAGAGLLWLGVAC